MKLFCMSVLQASEYACGVLGVSRMGGLEGSGLSLSSVGRSRRCGRLREAGWHGGRQVLLVVRRVAQEA